MNSTGTENVNFIPSLYCTLNYKRNINKIRVFYETYVLIFLHEVIL